MRIQENTLYSVNYGLAQDLKILSKHYGNKIGLLNGDFARITKDETFDSDYSTHPAKWADTATTPIRSTFNDFDKKIILDELDIPQVENEIVELKAQLLAAENRLQKLQERSEQLAKTAVFEPNWIIPAENDIEPVDYRTEFSTNS